MSLWNDYYNTPVEDTRILFKDMILNNTEDIKSFMLWENYGLNDNTMTVVDLVKDHALIVLMNSYGMFHVEQDIFDSLCADIFIHFPVLLQQLAITRLVDAYAVGQTDHDSVTTTRTETLNSNIAQNSEMTAGTTVTDSNTLNTQQKTTGTVAVEGTASNTQTSSNHIENTSGVESTGTKSVNINYEMPEQSINGATGNFLTDTQGTPILLTSYAQTAAGGYTSSNPINTTEVSQQTASNTNSGTNDSTTTNNVTVADTGTTTRTLENGGSDITESTTATTGTNTITETVTSNLTNKQYSYEIKAFLDTADSLIAFARWEDKFSWVVGII